MTRVLALDPGERVGWARADVADDGTWTNLRHGITPLRDMALAVHNSLLSPPDCGLAPTEAPSWYDVIVCEDWRLYSTEAKNMIGSAFPSVQFIGMVRLCCWLSGTKLVMQGASIKKHALLSMKAQRPELYAKVTAARAHDDAHDCDALMHLHYWAFKNCDVRKEAA